MSSNYPSAPPPGYGYGYPGGPPAQQQGNGMAVSALVLGIIGLVLFWIPLIGWILAILAIVFGGVGMAKANKGASGKGMAIAGLVLGIVSLALWIVILIAAAN